MNSERALRILERAGLAPRPIDRSHWLYRQLPADQPFWTIQHPLGQEPADRVEVLPEAALIALATSLLQVCSDPRRWADFTREVRAHQPAIRDRLN
jgi:hypothetical protein